MWRNRKTPLNAEHVRILRAAADGRFRVNEHGRYVIDGAARPKRREREQLKRWCLIFGACDGTTDRMTSVKLTDDGRQTLAEPQPGDAHSWDQLEVVRDAEGCLDELLVSVACASTEQAAEDRARGAYREHTGRDDFYVPVAAERVWMTYRPVNLDDEEEAGFAEEYGELIVAECEPDADGAREFWRVVGADPSEVEMVRGEVAGLAACSEGDNDER